MKSPCDPRSSRPRLRQRKVATELLIRGALWSVLIAVVSYTTADPDLWGHVRFGLDLFRDLNIPTADPYSFTSDRAWVNHEWAAEAVMAGAFRVAGSSGLVLLKTAAVLSFCFLLHRTLAREGVGDALSRDLIAAVAIVMTMEQAHHVRPQLFSLVCFSGLLSCLARGVHNPRWLIALPPLFAVWANVHGGWIVGGAVIASLTIGLAAGGARNSAIWFTGAGAASLAATLATPYGVGLWTFLGETVGFNRADIREWQPIYVLGPNLWLLWLMTLGLAATGLAQTKRTDIRWERVLVVAVLAIMSLQVSRLLAFFALSTLFCFGGAIVHRLGRVRVAGSSHRRVSLRAVCAVAVCVIVVAVPTIAVNAASVRIDPRHVPEAAAVEFLRARASPARVLVWFNWGQYAIWHLPAGMQVSIDGRRETVYSAALQERHLRFYFDLPGGAALPGELNADYVWLPRWVPAAKKLRAHHDWTLVYERGQSDVFARAEIAADRPKDERVAQGITPRRLFPGP
jgi:hypothetical protein